MSAQTGRTSVFVTHSVEEVVFLGSRVVVLTRRPGRIALDLDVDLPRTGVEPDELCALPEYAALRAEVGHAVRAAAFYAHLTKPEHIVRHRWRTGDVAMWDNRSTAHYANRDYGDAHRVMHRITLRGDHPFGPAVRTGDRAAGRRPIPSPDQGRPARAIVTTCEWEPRRPSGGRRPHRRCCRTRW
ncbi:TauD/TfdA family dioxygenase [Microbispora sp. H10830]|uniref:TauD/TfdA family dioxygenase n=1 Tax=Microbispora sp. H10830 TaxID=2729109 RepID=UPI0028738217|nr:TauD/TfdA family dioxygenase [Microbispora sp. H10830]